MDRKSLFLLLLALGLIFFIASVVLRRKKKTRSILISLGILTSLIPLFTYAAYSLTMFIKERPMVGTYQMSDSSVGKVDIQLFHNNTFEMKAESCSQGFVQGTWEYVWKKDGQFLELNSTSQRMGLALIGGDGEFRMNHVPICLKLVSELNFKRISKETTAPSDPFSY